VIILSFGGFLLFGNTDNTAPDGGGSGTAQNADSQDTIPNVRLNDESGNTVLMHDVALGKPAIINTWATWCPFCVDELPEFAELQAAYRNDVRVIAVNRAESQARAEGYLSDLGVLGGMIYLYDGGDAWYRAIGGFSMPETLFVDAEGVIVLHKRGPLTFEEADAIVRNQLITEN